MRNMPAGAKGAVFTVTTGLFVAAASYVIEATVPASDMRNAFILWMWPLGLICATVVIWRVLGSPEQMARRAALSRVIEAGVALAAKMRSVPDSDQERGNMTEVREPWRLRFGDWEDEAERVLRDVAEDRVAAFRADLAFTGADHIDAPSWIADVILDLELRIQALRNIRASL